ncbi:helix-turn-helix domain-containing protein [Hymenobacter chitinivorans]|uniref:AraC-like DNA-binding protein n=1 Tax=Hymenobacter chitinivorans DSM 11115 TaxID=1121954 RepID=A0A2M9BL06_9BACT|nr:AraC family transcriptional regulator [Hymenobacter chitinivorans]PJJ58623.1 AraC-like DNA-binding protein [Hymenobacter chitinivorans DSM 11115]
MDIYNLPHDPCLAGVPAPADVLIRSYSARRNTVKNKIVLHQNMLNLLVEGRKTIAQAAGSSTVYQDEIVLLAAGHCLTSEVLSDAGEFRSIIVYFSTQVLEDFYRQHAPQLGQRHPAAAQPLVTFAKDGFIRHYIDSLSLLLQAPTALSPALQRLKLEELLLYLLHTAPASLLAFQLDSRLARPELGLRSVVEAHVNRLITVEELAFLCHMSVSTFQRRFAEIYGQSPHQWLLKQRMQRAAHLLRQPQQLAGEVYQQVGYESYSSFAEAFKKTFGLSPRAFQQQMPGAE